MIQLLAAMAPALMAGATQMASSAMQVNADKRTLSRQLEEADINRQWETEMANTAHQREVKDLVAAGLNPMLAINGGAATPTSPVPNLKSPDYSGFKDVVSNSARTFNEMRLNKELVETQITQQDSNSAVAAKTNAEALKTLQEVEIKSPHKNLSGALDFTYKMLADAIYNSAKSAYIASDDLKTLRDEHRSGIYKPRRKVEVFPAN